MKQDFLIELVEGRCNPKAKKVYIDPTEMASEKATRIKLLGARITNTNLKDLQKILEGKSVETRDGLKTITRISRNDYSTGGFYTSKEDVCVYLQ